VVVFSLTGQPVWSTNTGKVPAGKHTVQVDGTAFSPGVYFVTIRDGRHSVSRKIVRL